MPGAWFGVDTDWEDVKRILTGLRTSRRVGAGHDPATLDDDADNVLNIGAGDTPQEIGLEDQTENTVFAGPVAAPAAKPDFRALVAADIPDHPGRVMVGGIILWSGAIVSIPANWQLCDGTNGTPDLRNRFVVGAGDTYAVDATGGSTTKDLEHNHGPGTYSTDTDGHEHNLDFGLTASTPDHVHDYSDQTGGPSSTTTWGNSDSPPGPAKGDGTHTHLASGTVDAAGSHQHGAGTLNTDIDTHGHGVTGGTSANAGSTAQDILPPYYALAYIMRTS
jgi:hypothetical protein